MKDKKICKYPECKKKVKGKSNAAKYCSLHSEITKKNSKSQFEKKRTKKKKEERFEKIKQIKQMIKDSPHIPLKFKEMLKKYFIKLRELEIKEMKIKKNKLEKDIIKIFENSIKENKNNEDIK